MTYQSNDVDGVVAQVRGQLVPLVNQFRSLQDNSGRVVRSPCTALYLLDSIETVVVHVGRELGQPTFCTAFCEDLHRWRSAGMERKPDFIRTQRGYRPGPDGSISLFAGPIVTANGPPPVGYRLECFLAQVDEPAAVEETCRRLGCSPLGCAFVRFIAGSRGFACGNCIVAFSESVATEAHDRTQHFALFLLNKFQRIYQHQTLPQARRLFGPADILYQLPRWVTSDLAPRDCYAARCAWAVGHEHHHQIGPRPLRDNLRLKMRWCPGLLEELKVDAQVALAAGKGELPYSPEVLEFILLDRMLRYPRHPDAVNNFDAGTGVFLFEWLAARGIIRPKGSCRLHLDLPEALESLKEFVAQVLLLETLPGPEYLAQAEALVRTLLPPGKCAARFAMPRRFADWTRLSPTRKALVFDRLTF